MARKKNTRMFTDSKGKDVLRRDGAQSKGSKYFTTDAQGRHKSLNQKGVEEKLKPTTANKPTGMEPRYNTINPPSQKALPNKTGLTATDGRTVKYMGNAEVVPPKALPAPKTPLRKAASTASRFGLYGKVAAGALIAADLGMSLLDEYSKKPTQNNKAATNSFDKPLTKGTVRDTPPVVEVDIRKKPTNKKGLSEFEQAFASARSEGKSTFDFKGKPYHTRTKEEEAARVAAKKPAPAKKPAATSSKYKVERADVWKDYFND
jgi:hypothetical protein